MTCHHGAMVRLFGVLIVCDLEQITAQLFNLLSGPEPHMIYGADGYTTYLLKHFPKLDYIDRCYIIDEVDADDNVSEGEF